MNDPLREIHSHYEPRISPDRDNFDVLDWASAGSQVRRFQVLVDHVPLAGRTLLDVGCGLGDLWAYLQRRDVAARYIGVDIVVKMIHEAHRRHPAGDFRNLNVFDGHCPPIRSDVVFASGMFNLNLGNNYDFLARAISRFYEIARQRFVVNLLHHRTPDQPGRYFYYDPDRVIHMLLPLPVDVEILDDYLPNDFTLIATRRDLDDSANG